MARDVQSPGQTAQSLIGPYFAQKPASPDALCQMQRCKIPFLPSPMQRQRNLDDLVIAVTEASRRVRDQAPTSQVLSMQSYAQEAESQDVRVEAQTPQDLAVQMISRTRNFPGSPG